MRVAVVTVVLGLMLLDAVALAHAGRDMLAVTGPVQKKVVWGKFPGAKGYPTVVLQTGDLLYISWTGSTSHDLWELRGIKPGTFTCPKKSSYIEGPNTILRSFGGTWSNYNWQSLRCGSSGNPYGTKYYVCSVGNQCSRGLFMKVTCKKRS